MLADWAAFAYTLQWYFYVNFKEIELEIYNYVKLSMWFKNHAIKTYGGVEVNLQAFSKLEGGKSCQLQAPAT
jgi:hypothetical protein